MNLSDLLEIRPFPAVVQAATIRELRLNPDSPAAQDFIGGYLGFDTRARHALETGLHSLQNPQNGGAFWLNGVFGCGKSHLLGLLALLCDGAGHETFAKTHPHLQNMLANWPPRLVVHFSLDDYDAARFSLEEIFWRELENEWGKRGIEPLNINRDGARGESFAALQDELSKHNLGGLCVFIDELSLFLGAREHKALQGDAAFLQFLGQNARRAPLWVFAALQKTVEDIGGIESYSLSQIRDRYTLLPLSLAHLPTLIERRLVEIKDAEAMQKICDQTYAQLAEALPRLDFGPREWKSLFPFHPATVALLEAAVARFFSRTRGAVTFCVHSFDGEKPAQFRVPIEAIWDYFEPELEAHPDLRPLLNVWQSWDEAAPQIAPREADIGVLKRVMKALLLFKIAGQSPTSVQIANALALDLGLSGDGHYDYARLLLERLRTRASFLALERGEEPILDRYAVDLGRRVGELARRHLQNTLATLEENDPRVSSQALESCRDEPLPLADYGNPRAVSVWWHNGAFRVQIAVWDGHESPETVANRAAATRDFGAPDEAFLLIAPPFGTRHFDWQSATDKLENGAALWFWQPRAPLRDEEELAREATAAHLLEADPQLADNRRGRAVLEHLASESAARRAAIARVALRLLREGEIILGTGAVLEAAELAEGQNFNGALESVADFALPQLFPKWREIAPRARILTPSNADTLCLEILRRPAAEPFFAPSLERLARHLGEPLGVAKASAGRWKIAEGRAELSAEILRLVGNEGVAFSALEAALSKGEWGLRSEQIAIVVCALLRGGELAAFDARGQNLAAHQIGLPLRRAVYFLKPGRLLESALWTKLAQNGRAIFEIEVGARNFVEQEKIASEILVWRQNRRAEAELFAARLAQLRRQIGESSWPNAEAALEAIAQTVAALPDASAPDLLAAAANLDGESLRPILAKWNELNAQLETRLAPLLAAQALLNHPELAAPPQLSGQRAEILSSFGAGEAVLEDEKLLENARDWAANYAEEYAKWHNAQNDLARGASLRRLAASDELRALERLASLRHRPLANGAQIRADLGEEIAKLCPRDGKLGAGEAVCSSCGLRLGQRVVLRSFGELETAIEAGFNLLRRVLAESAVREFLERHNSAWLEWDRQNDSLLPFLTPENLRELDEALKPRRSVIRSRAALLKALENGGTRASLERAFANWLDGEQNLAEDDEVELAE